MNRRTALFLLIGLASLSVLLLVGTLEFSVANRQSSKDSGGTSKLRIEVVNPGPERKPHRRFRSLSAHDENYPAVSRNTNWDAFTPAPDMREMELRAETYRQLQQQYLDAQVALQQERNRQLQLQNERELWKKIEAESKGPICRRHRQEYCYSCWSVSGGFSK